VPCSGALAAEIRSLLWNELWRAFPLDRTLGEKKPGVTKIGLRSVLDLILFLFRAHISEDQLEELLV